MVPLASLETRLAFLAQPRLDGLAVGHREVRDAQLAERQLDVGHLRDPATVEDRLSLLREQAPICAADYVELVGLEPTGPACRGCYRSRHNRTSCASDWSTRTCAGRWWRRAAPRYPRRAARAVR